MLMACSAEDRAPVSIFALISSISKSGMEIHSRQPITHKGAFVDRFIEVLPFLSRSTLKEELPRRHVQAQGTRAFAMPGPARPVRTPRIPAL